jgi:hypothetical protein
MSQWLTPILRRQRLGGLRFEASPSKEFMRPYLKKKITIKGLVEWLKVEALSSSPSTATEKRSNIY